MKQNWEHTLQTHRTALRRAAIFTTAWQMLAALLCFGLLDVLLPLPNVLRGLFWPVLLLVLARRARREKNAPPEAFVARAVESRRPELDNALIHAVQFGAILTAAPEHPAAALMRREIERAERDMSELPDTIVTAATPVHRERSRLFAVLAVLLLSFILFPRACRFEIPRLFLFWQDNPPFTRTDFQVTPPGAKLLAGDSLTITVRVSGLLPDHLELVSETNGEPPQILPLTAEDTAVYTGRLTNLTRDTSFYMRGNTGRSRRYAIRIALPNNTPAAQKTNAVPQESNTVTGKDKPTNPPNPSKKLDRLADAQSKLARDMAAQAQQAKNNQADAAQQKADADPLRERQKALQQQAAEQARQLKKEGKPAPALEKALQAMRQALRASRSLPQRSHAAQQAAQQLQRAAQESKATTQRDAGNAARESVVTTHPNGAGRTLERTNPLAPGQGETAGTSAPRPLPTGKDRDAARYPVEYRALTRDYFKSVAGSQ